MLETISEENADLPIEEVKSCLNSGKVFRRAATVNNRPGMELIVRIEVGSPTIMEKLHSDPIFGASYRSVASEY